MQREREAMEAGAAAEQENSLEAAPPETDCPAEEAPQKVCPTALPALEFFEAGTELPDRRAGGLSVHDSA